MKNYTKLLFATLILTLCCTLSITVALAQNDGTMAPGVQTYNQTNSKDPIPLNGNGALGVSYNKTLTGLNFVQGSQKVTDRFATPAGSLLPTTVSIAGLSSGACIDEAFIYFTMSYSSLFSVPTTTPTVTVTNPATGVTAFTAAVIGTVAEGKCWGVNYNTENTRTYRVSVASSISGNGTYTVNITGTNISQDKIDGVTLLIIYTDPLATYQGSLVLADGDYTHGTVSPEYSASMTGFTACGTSTTATAFLIVSDMQNPAQSFNATLNGALVTGIPSNFWNFVQTSTSVSSGQTSSAFVVDDILDDDCYLVPLTGLYFRTTTCANVACTGTVLPILPIQLLSFTGNCVEQNSILLHWSTATETNNDYFTIERSADAISWETAGTVKGAGNSSATRNYEFIDSSPLSVVSAEPRGVRYYRLKQTDFDGKSQTFNSKQVAVDVTACAVQVFPNPAGNTLNIPYTAEQDGEVVLQVYDVIGKLVKEKSVAAVKGNNKFTMDLTTVAQGMYVLMVKGSIAKGHNYKFVKGIN